MESGGDELFDNRVFRFARHFRQFADGLSSDKFGRK